MSSETHRLGLKLESGPISSEITVHYSGHSIRQLYRVLSKAQNLECNNRWNEQFQNALWKSSMKTVGCIRSSTSTVSAIDHWQIGDVIRLQPGSTELVRIEVEGVLMFSGSLGQRSDYITVTITA